jgi:hypothetical protein
MSDARVTGVFPVLPRVSGLGRGEGQEPGCAGRPALVPRSPRSQEHAVLSRAGLCSQFEGRRHPVPSRGWLEGRWTNLNWRETSMDSVNRSTH